VNVYKTVKYIAAYIKVLALVILAGVVWSSCKKDGDITIVVPKAALNTINATSNTINVFQNGTRLNNLGSIGTGGKSGYFSVSAGMQTYQIKKADVATPEYLISDLSFALDSGKSYSLFVAGETADKVFKINDTSFDPVDGKAMVRFINTLPGTTNLDVTIGSLSFTNTAFAGPSSFTNINSGTNNLKISQAGSAIPVIDQTITLTAGTFYTIFTTGTLAGTGQDKLTARMVIN